MAQLLVKPAIFLLILLGCLEGFAQYDISACEVMEQVESEASSQYLVKDKKSGKKYILNLKMEQGSILVRIRKGFKRTLLFSRIIFDMTHGYKVEVISARGKIPAPVSLIPHSIFMFEGQLQLRPYTAPDAPGNPPESATANKDCQIQLTVQAEKAFQHHLNGKGGPIATCDSYETCLGQALAEFLNCN